MLSIQKKLSNSFYAILALPATAMGFALCIQISALSWILSTKYNLDIHEVGYVWLAGPLAGILGQLIVGRISDKTWFWGGRRRPFILIGGTVAALMLICLPNIDTIADFLGVANLLPIALVVALTLDLAINVSFNPTRSLIADVTLEGKSRTKGYTVMQTVSGFFGVLAYLIGAFIGKYELIYLGIIIVLGFSIIPALLISEPTQLQPPNKNEIDLVSGSADKTDKKQLTKIYLANGFSWIGVQTMFVFINVFICNMLFQIPDPNLLNDEQGRAVGKVADISFAIFNTIGFLFPILVLQFSSNKIGRVTTHSVFMLLMALAYACIFLFAKNAITLYVLMAFAGMGWACIVSLPFAIMSEKVNATRMGYFMGIFNLSIVIPQLLVSLIVSHFISEMDDKKSIFAISAISLFLSFVFWRLVKDKARHLTDTMTTLPGSGH